MLPFEKCAERDALLLGGFMFSKEICVVLVELLLFCLFVRQERGARGAGVLVEMGAIRTPARLP